MVKAGKAAGVEITYKNIEEPGVLDENPEPLKKRLSAFVGDEGSISTQSATPIGLSLDTHGQL
ncbi:MAG: hypothetical protein AB1597_06030 [Chloroflexota bacterium]